MCLLSIHRLTFYGPFEEIERLKQYNGKGSWLVQPFSYEIGQDGYYYSCFTSYVRDSVDESLDFLSKEFPNTRLIHTRYTDYGESPLELYFTNVYEAGKCYDSGSGSMSEFDSVEKASSQFGFKLDLKTEKIAKKMIFNDKTF